MVEKLRTCLIHLAFLTLVASPIVVHSQERERGRASRQVFRDRVVPHWSGDGDRFWYRVDLGQGKKEFVFVDAEKGLRELAFDHAQVAKAIGNDATAERLPIERIEFTSNKDVLLLHAVDQRWAWNRTTQKLESLEGLTAETTNEAVPSDNARAPRTGAETELNFENRMSSSVEIFWLDGEGGKRSYGKINAGQRHSQHTFGGHRWLIINEKGDSLGEVVANDTPRLITIDGKVLTESARPRRRNRAGGSGARNPSNVSPDGKWRVVLKDFNVVIRSSDSDEEIALSNDGRDGQAYSNVSWSPDSQTLAAWRTEPAERLEVHLVRSSPPGGGRAVLESRPYALPGDEFTKHELNLFTIQDRQQLKPEVDRFEHEWEQPRVRWLDATRLAWEQTDRGHQRFRVNQVNLPDGKVSTIVDERTETFIWTAHTENDALPRVSWLENSNELIYVTEKSGWRHLQLIDVASQKEKNSLTSGKWIVRGIERIDQEKRQVWFRASGMFEHDPYFIHYGRVNFDGTGLVWLTEGNGTHAIEYSPDGRFIVDTYSRVDMAPVNELRRVDDGKLVCQLESARDNELRDTGWTPPEVFVSKGRDGHTDIWGIICRPKDFDPKKKYPLIEDIYAGPHGSFVPKSFSPQQRYESLNKLGFIVVKIDGMGTANRSKAFQDVCWHNLKDAGFEDRILWMKAAAAKYPEMDATRVGIYGTSAGGQNAAAAVLFHPEFYKAAVAACGCHDNRMDKASWNEQWMGYPVGAHYSQCSNIDNAHRLGGKLMLIVGEMDTNVPPESTMRFADALIRADKDFDLLVIPNLGHSNGGAYGVRRTHEFFVEHLKP